MLEAGCNQPPDFFALDLNMHLMRKIDPYEHLAYIKESARIQRAARTVKAEENEHGIGFGVGKNDKYFRSVPSSSILPAIR